MATVSTIEQPPPPHTHTHTHLAAQPITKGFFAQKSKANFYLFFIIQFSSKFNQNLIDFSLVYYITSPTNFRFNTCDIFLSYHANKQRTQRRIVLNTYRVQGRMYLRCVWVLFLPLYCLNGSKKNRLNFHRKMISALICSSMFLISKFP